MDDNNTPTPAVEPTPAAPDRVSEADWWHLVAVQAQAEVAKERAMRAAEAAAQFEAALMQRYGLSAADQITDGRIERAQ